MAEVNFTDAVDLSVIFLFEEKSSFHCIIKLYINIDMVLYTGCVWENIVIINFIHKIFDDKLFIL